MDHLSEQEGDLLPADYRAAALRISTISEPCARVRRDQDLLAVSMDLLHRVTAPA
ncbi:MAG: hypothetical protein LCH88_06100 [Proteobacteria bacterium]|nr:hypothetical protein [Pseudomonadota bacterium]